MKHATLVIHGLGAFEAIKAGRHDIAKVIRDALRAGIPVVLSEGEERWSVGPTLGLTLMAKD